jgi:hypothetical protein
MSHSGKPWRTLPIGAIKAKEDEEEVPNIDRPSSSNVPHEDEKYERHANEDTFVSHEQARVQAEDVDAPRPSSQVVDKRNSSLLQAHPQDKIIGSPSQGVITHSHKHASFIEHHSLFLVLSLHVYMRRYMIQTGWMPCMKN